jgi:alditol oxidase
MVDLRRNWAGNQRFQPSNVHQPGSRGELHRIVAGSTRVKAIGSRHSFNTIADTSGDLISLANFDHVTHIDPDRMTATVGAGIPYASFCAELHEAGYAVHNMASLPQITLAGACATATHGSGDQNGNLATAVRALTLVTAEGDAVTIDREEQPDDFRAIVVGLGGFGIVTDMTLDILPAYSVRQDIYDDLPLDALWSHFDEIMGLGYSVSLFTDWQGQAVNQLWIKRLDDPTSPVIAEPEKFGSKLSTVLRHPSPGKPVEDCTEQLGSSGPWHERLPHFRVNAVGSTGEDLQTEYFVDRRFALDALKTVADLKSQLAPVIKVSEVRTVAADDLWMSTAYRSDCVGIHFSWHMNVPAVDSLMPVIEEALRPFAPRPHWGKLFTMAPDEIASRYPRFQEFRDTMHRYDPHGKFRNPFLDKYVPAIR